MSERVIRRSVDVGITVEQLEKYAREVLIRIKQERLIVGAEELAEELARETAAAGVYRYR